MQKGGINRIAGSCPKSGKDTGGVAAQGNVLCWRENDSASKRKRVCMVKAKGSGRKGAKTGMKRASTRPVVVERSKSVSGRRVEG